jgi:uncharacterized repeat protein (TIGR03806 family)
MRAQGIIAVSAVLLAAACGVPSADQGTDQATDTGGPPGIDVEMPPPEQLGDANLFEWNGSDFVYPEGVHPYEMNSPLFTDYAIKERAIFVPEGVSAQYDSNQVFDFPVGTVILKSFLFPEDFREPEENLRLIETRLLVRYEDGWEPYPYVWNEEGTEAELKVQGEVMNISFIDAMGDEVSIGYVVPQRNQCIECHELKDADGENFLTPIGTKARHMNRDYLYSDGSANQLQHLADAGALQGLPPLGEVDLAHDFENVDLTALDTMDWETLDEAARDYLDINCAHCHNPDGVSGITSQMFLNHDNEDMFRLGVCKKPGSAGTGNGGLTYDIVPGKPEESILYFRMETEDLGAMMPLLGRTLAHTEGNAIIEAWIARFEGEPCEEEPSP